MSAPAPDSDELARVTEQRWTELNAPFSERGGKGPVGGPDWLVEAGRPGLLLTAVHGVRHVRPGRGWKAQDAGTGGLARALAEVTGWSAAIVLRSDRADGDANFDGDHPLKLALAEVGLPGAGGVLLDLHGMAGQRSGADLALGLGQADDRSRAAAQIIALAARGQGLRVTADQRLTPFAGTSAGTMTTWAQELGASAVQLEMAPQLRFDHMPRSNRIRLVSALLQAMTEIERQQ